MRRRRRPVAERTTPPYWRAAIAGAPRGALAVAIAAVCLAAAEIPAAWSEALERISAGQLKGHVSFLAADALEGRDTPSRGLDIAAEYIAAQFRSIGLEPGGDGYFQTAHWQVAGGPPAELALTIHAAGRLVRAAAIDLAAHADRAVRLEAEEPLVVKAGELDRLRETEVDGKVVAFILSRPGERIGPEEAHRRYSRAGSAIRGRRPALLLVADPSGYVLDRLRRPRLIDPEDPPRPSFPVIAARGELVAAAMDEPGLIRLTAGFEPRAPEPVRLKNVVGVLRGAHRELRKTAVLVSAHYDHLGVKPFGEGDRIYNGANDNASGVASLIETARALASLSERPPRSVVFATFFGEEKGLRGAGYYVRHPVFPLAGTVANINLEQTGRTDSDEGPRIRRAWLTGFEYSDIGRILRDAGRGTGVAVEDNPRHGNAYFRASDNLKLAEEGVPAHTLSVTYGFPDYHRPGDHWDKVDYENMAAVTRLVALGVLRIASAERPPEWNPASRPAEPYRKARKAPGVPEPATTVQ